MIFFLMDFEWQHFIRQHCNMDHQNGIVRVVIRWRVPMSPDMESIAMSVCPFQICSLLRGGEASELRLSVLSPVCPPFVPRLSPPSVPRLCSVCAPSVPRLPLVCPPSTPHSVPRLSTLSVRLFRSAACCEEASRSAEASESVIVSSRSTVRASSPSRTRRSSTCSPRPSGRSVVNAR